MKILRVLRQVRLNRICERLAAIGARLELLAHLRSAGTGNLPWQIAYEVLDLKAEEAVLILRKTRLEKDLAG